MITNYHDVRTIWDRLGVFLSSLCLIHCLLLPILALALPWLGLWTEDDRIHLAFAALAVPVALLALIPGYFRHHRQWILLLGLSGALLLLGGALGHEFLGHEWEHRFTVLGGILLVGGHTFNYRFGLLGCTQELCEHGRH